MGDDVILDFVVVNEDRIVDGWTFEEAGIVADVIFRLKEEVGRRVDGGSVPEILEEVFIADEDAVLDLFDKGEDVFDEASAFAEADVVVDFVLRLDETMERRVDRGLVLEDVEEIVISDDDVAPEILGVSEDKVDDASTVEDGKDVECVDVNSNSRSVKVVEDGEDVVGAVIDVVLELNEEVVKRVNDDWVPEDTEEVVGINDDVVLDPVDVGEDGTDVEFVLDSVEDAVGGKIGPVPRSDGLDETQIDDDSELEILKDVACVIAEYTRRSFEAVEGKFDDSPVGEDERDGAGVFIDFIS